MILSMREHGCCRGHQVEQQAATRMQPSQQKSAKRMDYGKLEHFLVSNSYGSKPLYTY